MIHGHRFAGGGIGRAVRLREHQQAILGDRHGDTRHTGCRDRVVGEGIEGGERGVGVRFPHRGIVGDSARAIPGDAGKGVPGSGVVIEGCLVGIFGDVVIGDPPGANLVRLLEDAGVQRFAIELVPADIGNVVALARPVLERGLVPGAVDAMDRGPRRAVIGYPDRGERIGPADGEAGDADRPQSLRDFCSNTP